MESCQPETDFLLRLSSTLHTCVPTNSALLSSVLGTISIVAWLFAQMPQIYKNHRLKSTSGLSFFFLAEWLLGDLTNLLGSVLTNQALWQIIIASYYCIVDFVLMGQWLWYEKLRHGRPLRSIWSQRWEEYQDNDNMSIASNDTTIVGRSGAGEQGKHMLESPSVPIPRSSPQSLFRTPNFARMSPAGSPSFSSTPNSRTVIRTGSGSSPMPSPRTVLALTLLLAVLTNASPLHTHETPHSPTDSSHEPLSQTLGRLFSWTSTFLYLGSRLPQLYNNHCRRSTAGLSPTLFAAAFFGNLFYSSSMLANPCAWNTFAPYKGQGPNPSRGWTGPEGSNRDEWIGRAAPFFLGAAGVLLMDATVGLQFWWFGSHPQPGLERPTTLVVVVSEEDVRRPGRTRWRWRRVSGWMRGWVPSLNEPSSPRSKSPISTEQAPLVRSMSTDSIPEDDSPKSYGALI